MSAKVRDRAFRREQAQRDKAKRKRPVEQSPREFYAKNKRNALRASLRTDWEAF